MHELMQNFRLNYLKPILRQQRKSKYDENGFKLMNNALFVHEKGSPEKTNSTDSEFPLYYSA